MNTNSVIESRLEAWLSHGPEAAPDHLLDAVLAAVPTVTRRERIGILPRSSLRQTRLAQWAAATAVAVGIGVLGLISLSGLAPQPSQEPASASPGPYVSPRVSPSSSPDPGNPSLDTSRWDSFTSDYLGLSFAYPPDGWIVNPAIEPWPIDTDPRSSSSVDEVWSSGLERLGFWTTSQAVAGDLSELDWVVGFGSRAGTRSICYPPGDPFERITVDGRPAYLLASDACGIFQAFAFLDGRVYVLTGEGYPAELGPMMKRELFDAFLTTVQFDPAAAR